MEGSPPPQIVWMSQSQGRLREKGRNYEIVGNQTRLVFTNVEKDNEDRYRCRVSVFGPGRLGEVMVFLRIFTLAFLLFLAPAGGSNPAGQSFTLN